MGEADKSKQIEGGREGEQANLAALCAEGARPADEFRGEWVHLGFKPQVVPLVLETGVL